MPTFVSGHGIIEYKRNRLTLEQRFGAKLVLRGDKATNGWADLETAWNSYWDAGCKDFGPVNKAVFDVFAPATLQLGRKVA